MIRVKKKSEKSFSEATNSTIYLLSLLLTKLGAFIVVPLFWRKLTLADYGYIAILEIIGSIIGFVSTLQIENGITRYYYDWTVDDRKRHVGALLSLSVFSVSIVGGGTLGIVFLISDLIFSGLAFFPIVFWGVLYQVLLRFLTVPNSIFRIVNKPLQFSLISITSISVQLSMNIYFVLVKDLQLYGYVISNCIYVAMAILMYYSILFKYSSFNFNIKSVEDSLFYSFKLLPGSAIGAITKYLDRIILVNFVSVETMGVYSVAQKFSNIVVNFHSAIKISFIPEMVKHFANDITIDRKKAFSSKPLNYLAPIFIVSFTISLFIDNFILFWNVGEFINIIGWVVFFVGLALIGALNIYLAPGLLLSKRSDLTWIPTIGQLVVVVVLGPMLIPKFGLTGVVITGFISSLIFFIINMFLSHKNFALYTKYTTVLMWLIVYIMFLIVSSLIQLNYNGNGPLVSDFCLFTIYGVIIICSTSNIITEKIRILFN